jgi:hypothetical protein
MKIHERRTTVSRKRFPVKTTTLIRGTPPSPPQGTRPYSRRETKKSEHAQSTGEMLAEEEQTNENQRTAMNSTDRVENETKKKQTTRHMVRLRRKPTVVGALQNLLKTIEWYRYMLMLNGLDNDNNNNNSNNNNDDNDNVIIITMMMMMIP